MTTIIADHFFDEIKEEDEKVHLTNENIPYIIVDLSFSLKTRIDALNLYYATFGGNNTIEVINKLGTMYEMSGTILLKKYLYTITHIDMLEPFLQSLCAKALWSYNKQDEIALTAINNVYQRFNQNTSTPYKIEFIKMLSESKTFKDKALDYFLNVINDKRLESDYRYKLILQVEVFAKDACISFLTDDKNKIRLRILAAQNLINRNDLTETERDYTETILLQISNDETHDCNTRADATDILLQRGTNIVKKKAEEIILKLGYNSERSNRTLYNNAQNVHTREIEKSVLQIIEFLYSYKSPDEEKFTVDYIKEQVLKITPPEKVHRVTSSFGRISLDRALYSQYMCTLAHTLTKVWTFLSQHKDREEIQKRLVEELYEMAETCSSGFASRLVNVISGFSDFSIKISWEDQISSNLSGRLNAQIRECKDEENKQKIIEEMSNENITSREHYISFIRETLPILRDEMWREFKDYIPDSDFDLYFRKAMIMYEIGERDI